MTNLRVVIWPVPVRRLPPDVVRLPLQQAAVAAAAAAAAAAHVAAAVAVAAAAPEGLVVRLVHADLVGLVVVPLLDLEDFE